MPKKRKAATSRASNLEAAREVLKRQESMDPVAVTGTMVEREADVDVIPVVCSHTSNDIN